MIGCAFMLFFLLATLWRSPWLAGCGRHQWTVHTGGHRFKHLVGHSHQQLELLSRAVAFGIAIDDGIHLTGYFSSFLKSRFSLKRPLKAVQAKWR